MYRIGASENRCSRRGVTTFVLTSSSSARRHVRIVESMSSVVISPSGVQIIMLLGYQRVLPGLNQVFLQLLMSTVWYTRRSAYLSATSG